MSDGKWAGPQHSTPDIPSGGGRRTLSRREVLRWQAWTPPDLAKVERHLARTGAVTFYTSRGGEYVKALDAAARTVMTITPGYLEFPPAWASEECDEWHCVRLARPAPRPVASPRASRSAPRAQGRTPSSPTQSGSQRFCPIHFTELSNTGVCGYCE